MASPCACLAAVGKDGLIASMKQPQPERPSDARASVPGSASDQIAPKTLRLVLDPDHPAGVLRFVWWDLAGRLFPYEPGRKQDLDSIRAFAIALLCTAHCRQNGPAQLISLGTLAAKELRGGWELKALKKGNTWLTTLGNAFENRNKQANRKNKGNRPASPIGDLCKALPGLLNEQVREWTAARAKQTGLPSFWCRHPSLVTVGYQAGDAGPNLLFRLAGMDSDLPLGSDWLALARQLENNQRHWGKLLTSGSGVEEEPETTLGPEAERVAARRCRADISRIIKYAPAELIGREDEINLLNNAWAQVRDGAHKRPRILAFVALGGEGKTSLVAKWTADLAYQDWPGCDAAFAWSFYRQGAREQLAGSSDLFLNAALTFFGDEAAARSGADAFDKGRRLAVLVGRRRSLLILDGLEPLQHAPSSPHRGGLKDQGVAELLKTLAQNNDGLCVVTTRYSLPDLQVFRQGTAPEVELKCLSRAAGVHLLRSLGVKGSELRNLPSDDDNQRLNEFEKLVEDVKGHALTLTVMGGFLKRAFQGDIRKRDQVKFDRADDEVDGGHAFRAMAAYEQWLARDGGKEGRREAAVLRIMGLFDRPADAGWVAALRCEPIRDLTDALAGLGEEDWNECLSDLEAARLLTVNRDTSGALLTLDAHPLLRAYFAHQLRTQSPAVWRDANQRLHEHLSTSTPDKPQPTIEDLQPLYLAVAYGARAGLFSEALVLYKERLLLGQEYAEQHCGAFGAGLAAISTLLEEVGAARKAPSAADLAYVHLRMGTCLRSLGRLLEGAEHLEEAKRVFETAGCLPEAAHASGRLCILNLFLGKVPQAIGHGRESVRLADEGRNVFSRAYFRTTLGLALCYRGSHEAADLFCEARALQQQDNGRGDQRAAMAFRRCEWLESRAQYGEMVEVATEALQIAEAEQAGLLFFGLLHTALGRAHIYQQQHSQAGGHLDKAIAFYRKSATWFELPRGLLARAWLRCLHGTEADFRNARADLDEIWEIATRGPMKLHLADVRLARVKFFCRLNPYPWESPATDLAAAEKLIQECEYHRRDGEIVAAKSTIQAM